jgi:hypothetical protein
MEDGLCGLKARKSRTVSRWSPSRGSEGLRFRGGEPRFPIRCARRRSSRGRRKAQRRVEDARDESARSGSGRASKGCRRCGESMGQRLGGEGPAPGARGREPGRLRHRSEKGSAALARLSAALRREVRARPQPIQHPSVLRPPRPGWNSPPATLLQRHPGQPARHDSHPVRAGQHEGPQVHVPRRDPDATKVGQVDSASVGWAMKPSGAWRTFRANSSISRFVACGRPASRSRRSR